MHMECMCKQRSHAYRKGLKKEEPYDEQAE